MSSLTTNPQSPTADPAFLFAFRKARSVGHSFFSSHLFLPRLISVTVFVSI